MAATVEEQAAATSAARAPSPGGLVVRLAVFGLIGAVVLAVPLVTPTVFLNVVARAAVFALVALSMNVLVGYAGQVSLGHQAFLGIGAFSAAYLLTELSMPWGVGLLVGGVTGGGAALLLGGIALRVRGLYLALVTLAYGLFAQGTVFNLRDFTGGGAGMPAPRPAFASGDIAYVYLCIAVVGIALLVDRRLVASRAGRAIQALRDDERVAASWGINVTWYKLLAFVISGVLAGVAGTLFASIEQIVVAPDFSLTLALTFLLMAVLGGVGSRAGVVQAGVLIAVLPTVLDNVEWIPIDGSVAPLLIALLVLATLAFFPGGFGQLQRPFWQWLRLDRALPPPGSVGVPLAAVEQPAAAGNPHGPARETAEAGGEEPEHGGA